MNVPQHAWRFQSKDDHTGKRRNIGCKGLCLCLLFVAFQIGLLMGFCTTSLWAQGRIKIGVLEEPRTLNIWLASDAWSNKVLRQIYQPLYIREPMDLKLIPWLAKTDPEYDEATLSYTIRLREALWSDGTEFTAEDVAFTGDLIREFRIPRLYSSWRFVKKIEMVDKHTVKIFLDQPKAIFLSRTLTTPIVQKREWHGPANHARRSERPLTHLLNHRVPEPIGTGPFRLNEWKEGAYVFLERNELFFGTGKQIAGYTLGPFIDGIILKPYGTADAAVLALKKGSIDMLWWGIQPGYLEDLWESDVEIFTSQKSALYYLGFNLRKPPFNDIHFRHAVATMADKAFIVKRILQGYAVKMNSIVPPGNAFWYCPDVPTYGEGLSREERIRKACNMLHEAGYRWKVPPVNAKGEVVKGEEILLPDGRPMEDFTILTPPADYDPLRAMSGIMLQEWLKMIGIPAKSRPMALGSLIQQVKSRQQFDLFVLGYGNLSLDPDYLRNFFISTNDRAGGWNMSGYRNPRFDRIAEESAGTMNLKRRRDLIWKMQKIIMRDIPYLPLYGPKLSEGVKRGTFKGWVKMVGGIGNTWSFCTIKESR